MGDAPKRIWAQAWDAEGRQRRSFHAGTNVVIPDFNLTKYHHEDTVKELQDTIAKLEAVKVSADGLAEMFDIIIDKEWVESVPVEVAVAVDDALSTYISAIAALAQTKGETDG